VLTGDLFLFVGFAGRVRHRAKVLHFEGMGMCLFAEHLEKEQFSSSALRGREPSCSSGFEMALSELALLSSGAKSQLACRSVHHRCVTHRVAENPRLRKVLRNRPSPRALMLGSVTRRSIGDLLSHAQTVSIERSRRRRLKWIRGATVSR
jgi:hypothetical protein